MSAFKQQSSSCKTVASNSASMTHTAIRVTNASKTFGAHLALKQVSFSVEKGETVALLGASGSGKSTLIRSLCGLEVLDANHGKIEVCGELIQSNGSRSPTIKQSRQKIGVIFQQFNLISQLDLITNVMIARCPHMPLWRILDRRFTQEDRALAAETLDKVGLLTHANQRASTLSGGQQQRAAVARALVQGANVILADEPVASLDPEAARNVMEILQELTQALGLTLVVSLHQVSLAQRFCARTIALRQGSIVFDGPGSRLTQQALADLYGCDVSEFAHTDQQPHQPPPMPAPHRLIAV